LAASPELDSTPCDTPDATAEDLVSTKGSAVVMRAASLTNVHGDVVRLGDVLGSNDAAAGDIGMVIFLRHLAWAFCWSYTKAVCALQQQEDMKAAGIMQGPVFVSVGTAAQLETFLELNPEVPKESVLVDNLDRKVYQSVGLKLFTETDPNDAKEGGKNISAPKEMKMGDWWKYLTNAAKLSPIAEDQKFGELPPGVLQLGGTFLLQGDDVIYQWNDRVPGDVPDLQLVLAKAKVASAAMAST
jgi:hypothetical protein